VKGPVQDEITRAVSLCDRGVTAAVVDEKRGWLFVASDDTTASAWGLVPSSAAGEPECKCKFEEHLVISCIKHTSLTCLFF